MPKTKLGKVSLSPKGTWEASTAYEQLDMVSYDGGSWLAKKPSTNITPADGEYWMKVAEKGDTGSDADVTKENIVKALGFEPEKPEGEYELIEEISIDTPVWQVTRTQETDGTPYKFKSMRIEAEFPANSTSTNIICQYVTANSNVVNSYMLSAYLSGKITYGISKLLYESGKYSTGWWTCSPGQGEYRSYYSNPADTYGISAVENPIIKYYMSAASVALLTGTIIRIYAVRM